jgi:hypothetical protein
MPFYTFLDTTTNEVIEVKLSLSEYKQFNADNPHLTRYYDISTIPSIVSGVCGIRNDNGWKEVLCKVSEKHSSSALAEKTLKKSIKQIKTQNIIKKHLGSR